VLYEPGSREQKLTDPPLDQFGGFFSQDVSVENWIQKELSRFDAVYRETASEVERFVTREAMIQLASHCLGWHPDHYDMFTYLKNSIIRYRQAYRYMLRHYGNRRVSCLDVGGFWGIFPAVLSKMGYAAALTEKYEYYAEGFDGIRDYLQRVGVAIYDVDPVLETISSPQRFELISCMALLEHLPHSPKMLFQNFRELLIPEGGLILEVPNLAYWYKRQAMLRGKTVLTHIEFIYHSKVPFIGHHHEYTRDELEWVLEVAGFAPLWFDTHNYSLRAWRKALMKVLPMSFHEVYMVFSIKRDQ